MSGILLSSILGGKADLVALQDGSRSSSSPSTFSISDTGTHTNMSSNQFWETVNNPSPKDTYHIKWEDHATFANPNVTPFAKSVWTLLSGAGPFAWSTTASPPDIVTRGFVLHISNDGGSTTIDTAIFNMTADESP